MSRLRSNHGCNEMKSKPAGGHKEASEYLKHLEASIKENKEFLEEIGRLPFLHPHHLQIK